MRRRILFAVAVCVVGPAAMFAAACEVAMLIGIVIVLTGIGKLPGDWRIRADT